MKNVVLVVVVVGIAVGGWFAWQKYQENAPLDEARVRVETILDSKARGDDQTALCMWALGRASLPIEEISAYTDRFDAFVRRNGLEKPSDYEIEDVRLEARQSVIVTVRVGRKELKLRVRPRTPIEVAR